MKAKHAPNLAALLIFAFCLTLKPGQAQLPPTNMSKHVRTPGDNQYQSEGRQFRHAPPPPPAVRQGPGPGQSSMPAWRKTPAPRVPDITLEPIAADEPVCQAGFPPLPDRLELPIANMGSKWNSSGGGGGAAPGGGGRQIQTSMHQHYKHITPGAYAPAKNNQAPQTGGGAAAITRRARRKEAMRTIIRQAGLPCPSIWERIRGH